MGIVAAATFAASRAVAAHVSVTRVQRIKNDNVSLW